MPFFEATREHNIDTDPPVEILIAMAAPLSVGSSITVDGRDGVLQMEVCLKLTRLAWLSCACCVPSADPVSAESVKCVWSRARVADFDAAAHPARR